MTRRAITAAAIVLVLAGCGSARVASPPYSGSTPFIPSSSSTEPAPTPVAASLPASITSTTSPTHPWPKGNATTTCEEWTGVMTPTQRYDMSTLVLTQIWHFAGLYFTPESPRIQDFTDSVGYWCADDLKIPKGAFGALTPATDTILAVMLDVQKAFWPKFLGTPHS